LASQSVTIQLKSIVPNSELKFCSLGKKVNGNVGAVISKIQLTPLPSSITVSPASNTIISTVVSTEVQTISVPSSSVNLVNLFVNGDLLQNQCNNTYCIWNSTNYNKNYISGWTPDPQILIGKGNYYNSNFNINQMVL
jgi:hypothetical protein